MNRTDLAEKLEIIGSLFEIDGMDELVNKFKAGISVVKYNAITIQIESLLLKTDKELADRLVASNKGITMEDVEKMDDADFAVSLRDAITTDVIGFFASSQRTGGQK